MDWFETVQSVRTVCASESLMTGPGEDLFDFMADKLKEFMVRIIMFITITIIIIITTGGSRPGPAAPTLAPWLHLLLPHGAARPRLS